MSRYVGLNEASDTIPPPDLFEQIMYSYWSLPVFPRQPHKRPEHRVLAHRDYDGEVAISWFPEEIVDNAFACSAFPAALKQIAKTPSKQMIQMLLLCAGIEPNPGPHVTSKEKTRQNGGTQKGVTDKRKNRPTYRKVVNPVKIPVKTEPEPKVGMIEDPILPERRSPECDQDMCDQNCMCNYQTPECGVGCRCDAHTSENYGPKIAAAASVAVEAIFQEPECPSDCACGGQYRTPECPNDCACGKPDFEPEEHEGPRDSTPPPELDRDEKFSFDDLELKTARYHTKLSFESGSVSKDELVRKRNAFGIPLRYLLLLLIPLCLFAGVYYSEQVSYDLTISGSLGRWYRYATGENNYADRRHRDIPDECYPIRHDALLDGGYFSRPMGPCTYTTWPWYVPSFYCSVLIFICFVYLHFRETVYERVIKPISFERRVIPNEARLLQDLGRDAVSDYTDFAKLEIVTRLVYYDGWRYRKFRGFLRTIMSLYKPQVNSVQMDVPIRLVLSTVAALNRVSYRDDLAMERSVDQSVRGLRPMLSTAFPDEADHLTSSIQAAILLYLRAARYDASGKWPVALQ